jgi:hypothetical protein
MVTRHRWLTLAILATQEAEIRRIKVQSQPRQIVHETILKTPITKQGLVEGLKVKALNSNPSMIVLWCLQELVSGNPPHHTHTLPNTKI